KSLLEEYEQFLSNKSNKTVDAYLRSIWQFTSWLSERPGSGGLFMPERLTTTAMGMYLEDLEANEYSSNYRNRVKSAVSSFPRWLIENDLLQQNPTQGVESPPQHLLAPREL